MTQAEQIKQCQTPDGYLHTGYSDAELKRMGKQSFCSICKRWRFKKEQCELFTKGNQ